MQSYVIKHICMFWNTVACFKTQLYVLMLIPDASEVEGKTVGFLFVDIDPIPSLKQAWWNIFENSGKDPLTGRLFWGFYGLTFFWGAGLTVGWGKRAQEQGDRNQEWRNLKMFQKGIFKRKTNLIINIPGQTTCWRWWRAQRTKDSVARCCDNSAQVLACSKFFL